MPFSRNELAAKLHRLTSTPDSIQPLAAWMVKYMQQHVALVDVWMKEFARMQPASDRRVRRTASNTFSACPAAMSLPPLFSFLTNPDPAVSLHTPPRPILPSPPPLSLSDTTHRLLPCLLLLLLLLSLPLPSRFP